MDITVCWLSVVEVYSPTIDSTQLFSGDLALDCLFSYSSHYRHFTAVQIFVPWSISRSLFAIYSTMSHGRPSYLRTHHIILYLLFLLLLCICTIQYLFIGDLSTQLTFIMSSVPLLFERLYLPLFFTQSPCFMQTKGNTSSRASSITS